MKRIILLSAFISAAALFAGCGGAAEITSKYAEEKIIVDGDDNDWQGKTIYLKDENMLVGFQNDSENLYLMISATDKTKQMQISRLGLTIWFDENGGTDKKFGIKYPIGGMKGGMPPMEDGGWTGGDEEGNIGPPEQLGRAPEGTPGGFDELEVYEPETESWANMSFGEARGIDVKIGRKDNNRIIYELKIALKPEDNLYFLSPKGGKIGVGIESNEIDKDKIKKAMKEGGFGGPGGGMGGDMGAPGGDMGGPGGGMGGPGGKGMRGKMKQAQTAQFKEWFDVTLAGK